MRILHTDKIIQNIKDMCIESNYILSPDVKGRIIEATEIETSFLGSRILEQLAINMDIAANESIPICQDTGMVVVFLRIGQELHKSVYAFY